MDTIKDAVKTVADKVTGQSDPKFPKPHEISSESQRGALAGLEYKMKTPPNFDTLETEGGFASYKPANKLLDKVAIITGGDSGIGRAISIMYAKEGADIAIVYLPEEEEDAQFVKQYVEKLGRRCLCLAKDISIEENCKSIVDTVMGVYGKIDILINNAAYMLSVDCISDVSTEQLKRTVETNVYGTFWLCKFCVPLMKSGSSIIQTTSQVAFTAPPMLLDYTMTKSAVLGLTRGLSNQLLSKGIRVNAVAPGPVWTPLQEAAMSDEKLSVWKQNPAPMGRIGQPSELGPAYVWLASNEASFLTGQVIHVNGGLPL